MEFRNIVETKSKGEKMYLISAYFDEHTTRQLQRFIDAVAQNTGNTYMIDNNVPPHLTISSFETRNPQNLCDDFVKLSELESHDINIFSVGEFLPYVIYVTPVLDLHLQQTAEKVYNILAVREDVSIKSVTTCLSASVAGFAFLEKMCFPFTIFFIITF